MQDMPMRVLESSRNVDILLGVKVFFTNFSQTIGDLLTTNVFRLHIGPTNTLICCGMMRRIIILHLSPNPLNGVGSSSGLITVEISSLIAKH